MNARYLTADVFTDRKFGGNQLAVFPDARQINSDLMPRIAQEFNYSETTFVLPPDDPSHTAKVRIFTPGGELQFAGHPTVGTAHVLASIGAIKLTGDETHIVLEEIVGPVPVSIHSTNGQPESAMLTAAKLPENTDYRISIVNASAVRSSSRPSSSSVAPARRAASAYATADVSCPGGISSRMREFAMTWRPGTFARLVLNMSVSTLPMRAESTPSSRMRPTASVGLAADAPLASG